MNTFVSHSLALYVCLLLLIYLPIYVNLSLCELTNCRLIYLFVFYPPSYLCGEDSKLPYYIVTCKIFSQKNLFVFYKFFVTSLRSDLLFHSLVCVFDWFFYFSVLLRVLTAVWPDWANFESSCQQICLQQYAKKIGDFWAV